MSLGVASGGLAQSSSPREVTHAPSVHRGALRHRRSLAVLICVGPADSALPTVIAEAPLGGDSTAFNALGGLLAGEEFRSCAYDLAGTGSSDPPPDGAEPGPGPVTLHDVAATSTRCSRRQAWSRPMC